MIQLPCAGINLKFDILQDNTVLGIPDELHSLQEISGDENMLVLFNREVIAKMVKFLEDNLRMALIT